MTPLRFCKDCRYVGPAGVESGVRKCLNPATAVLSTNYYDGIAKMHQVSIDMARILGRCGLDGVLWEPATT